MSSSSEAKTNSYVGIDISAERLDLHVLPTQQRQSLVYDNAEVTQLVLFLQQLKPALIVVETTGKLEITLVASLAAALLALARSCRACWWPICLNWDNSTVEKLPAWSDWPPSTAIAENGEANDSLLAGGGKRAGAP